MATYRIDCPACGWETADFERPFDADEAMQQHVRQAHPDWPASLHFRRETVI